MGESKLTVTGVEGRWTEAELRAAELLRLGATEESVAVELGAHVRQIQSLQKRKHFNDLLGLTVGPVRGYAEKWQEIRQAQLDAAIDAIGTIKDAIGDRGKNGEVTPVALRASEGLIKSLEKGVKQEVEGGSKELKSFMARLEEIAVKEAGAAAPKVIDVGGE